MLINYTTLLVFPSMAYHFITSFASVSCSHGRLTKNPIPLFGISSTCARIDIEKRYELNQVAINPLGQEYYIRMCSYLNTYLTICWNITSWEMRVSKFSEVEIHLLLLQNEFAEIDFIVSWESQKTSSCGWNVKDSFTRCYPANKFRLGYSQKKKAENKHVLNAHLSAWVEWNA